MSRDKPDNACCNRLPLPHGCSGAWQNQHRHPWRHLLTSPPLLTTFLQLPHLIRPRLLFLAADNRNSMYSTWCWSSLSWLTGSPLLPGCVYDPHQKMSDKAVFVIMAVKKPGICRQEFHSRHRGNAQSAAHQNLHRWSANMHCCTGRSCSCSRDVHCCTPNSHQQSYGKYTQR